VAFRSFFRRRPALMVLAVAIGVVSVGGSASPASAGLGLACPDPTTQPFAQWSDYANYAFVPNGGFESGTAGWTRTGGATVVSGNESFYVSGATHAKSLVLPAGATATSTPMCISLASTKMRFFLKGTPGAQVRVQVLYRGLLSSLLGLFDGGTVTATGEWQPSPEVSMLGGLLPLLTQSVQFKFTATSGTVQIDDVYLDPMMNR
jgi:hypothetical protein